MHISIQVKEFLTITWDIPFYGNVFVHSCDLQHFATASLTGGINIAWALPIGKIVQYRLTGANSYWSICEITHEKIHKSWPCLPPAQPALEINYVDCYISFEKTGFLASNRISLLSEFELWSTHQLHATAEPYGVIDPWNRFLGSLKGHGNEADFLGFLQKLVPHYLLSRSGFGFKFAEIFIIEKRLPNSASRWLTHSASRRVGESMTAWLAELESRLLLFKFFKIYHHFKQLKPAR